MTPEQKLQRRYEVGRAALAEAGVDPDAMSLRNGQIWCSRSVPPETAWRAYTLMRVALSPLSTCCLACYVAYRATDDYQTVKSCDSHTPFMRDCGRDPYEVAS